MDKICKRCNIKQSFKSFNKHPNTKDGYRPICNSCMRNDYQKNKHSILAKRKIHYEENKESIKTKCNIYYHEHKDESTARKKAWYYKNLDKGRLNARNGSRKRRALKKMVDEDYKDEKFTKAIFQNMCFRCSSKDRLEIDHHYPLDKGFALEKDNAVLLCKSCNASKKAKLPEEFYSSFELTQVEWILNTADILSFAKQS